MNVHFTLFWTHRQPRILYQRSFNIVPVPRNRQVSAVTCYSHHLMLFCALINSCAANWLWAGGCVRASLRCFFPRMGLCLSGVCRCCVHRRVTPCLCVFVKESDREAQGPFFYVTTQRVSFTSYKSYFHFLFHSCLFLGTGGTVLCVKSLSHWWILFQSTSTLYSVFCQAMHACTCTDLF